MAPDTTTPQRRGPRPIAARDWLFGYAPRRLLLTRLYGPGAPSQEMREKGLSAAQLADLAGKCRSGARSDIAVLEELGLLSTRRVGRRDRYFPRGESDLARSLCLLIESIERI